jgi:hypothetical protein
MNAPKCDWKLGLPRALYSESRRSTVSVEPITYRLICTLTRLTDFNPEDGGSICPRNVESAAHIRTVCTTLELLLFFYCCRYPDMLVG